MSKQPARKSTLDELLMEASMTFTICIVAIAKTMHEQTGELTGVFKCPRCQSGTICWSVAPGNKHARVYCTTKIKVEKEGQQVEHRCTQAME